MGAILLGGVVETQVKVDTALFILKCALIHR
jgi:hypothetical protein